METTFVSALVVLLLVVDPLGNIPLFVALLKNVDPARRPRVILRECLIAYVTLLVFVFFGRPILQLFGLSDSSLSIAGGVILFLIALRMIFRSDTGMFGDTIAGEPFIVPLAIPAIAGPTAIATVIVMVSRDPGRIVEWTLAVTAAMAVSLIILVFAERIAKRLGDRVVAAMERLLGLILTAVAVEMLLRGIEGFVRQIQAGG